MNLRDEWNTAHWVRAGWFARRELGTVILSPQQAKVFGHLVPWRKVESKQIISLYRYARRKAG